MSEKLAEKLAELSRFQRTLAASRPVSDILTSLDDICFDLEAHESTHHADSRRSIALKYLRLEIQLAVQTFTKMTDEIIMQDPKS